MNPQTKTVVAINQTSLTNAATGTGNIDTLGYDFAEIDVIATTSNAATNNPSVLKLAESDDTVVTNFADITEFVGDGAGGYTIPNSETAATNNPTTVRFNVDLRARKRYLKVSVSPVTTQNICAVAHLSKGKTAPVNTTDANVAALVEG